MSRNSGGVLAAVALSLATQAGAAMVSEYFNGYGSVQGDLAGKAGGSGWTAAWAGDLVPDYVPLADNAAFNLNYTAPGYFNTGNGNAPSDGLAMLGSAAGNAGNVVARTFRAGGTAADTGLDGTVWMSCLVDSGTATTSDMLLWIDRPDVTTSFIAIRDLSARMRYASVDSFGTANEYALSTTYLLLAKVVVNASGTNDSLEMWINPNLAGGEAGLGAARFAASSQNAYGNAISGVGVSFENYGKLDSIRISNGPAGFSDVTMVPEPGLLGVAAAAGCGLVLRRRSRHSR